MTPEQRDAWDSSGFFTIRGLVPREACDSIVAEVVDRIRADPPEHHAGEQAYFSGPNYLMFPETAPSPSAVMPEDRVSKVFNCHAEGVSRRVAELPQITSIVADLLGPDVDCFQSQFIFKNPGVIGQPWHQDSYYFKFDKQPQVGVWVALTRATLDNGCLWVLPGSHRGQQIFDHVPDTRPEAIRGYQEIVSQDTSSEVPSLMEAGDVLFFHSYLMHRSTDNCADERRIAMVYHYGREGTRVVAPPENQAALARVNRWIPVVRNHRLAAGGA